MNEPESVRAAVEAVANNPKVSGAYVALASVMGADAIISQINTVLGMLSLAIGCVVGIYMLRINAIRRKIYERMLANGESLKE